MYSFSCLFIMIMMKYDKGHKFIICCIVLHQQNFIGAHFSMLKTSLPEVLFCSFLQCEKFWNMELCTVVFCMFHTKYQCISLESFLPIYQTMIHYKQSKAIKRHWVWSPLRALAFSFIYCGIILKNNLHCFLKQGLFGFLLLTSVLGNSWGRCKSMAIATVPCVSFCALRHQTGGLFSEQFTDPSVIK